MREPAGRSRNQAQATSAPNIGVVALSTAARPLLMLSRAKQKSANGRPELKTPTAKLAFQCFAMVGPWPRSSAMGNRNSEAMATRTAAAGRAPNSAAPMRMKRKDAPQSAPSSTRSTSQAAEAEAGAAGAMAVAGMLLFVVLMRPSFFSAVVPRLSYSAPSSSRRAVLRSSPPA